MSTIEAGLRGAGIAILLLIAVLGWRDARRAAAARYGMLFMLCGACYLVESAPGLIFIEPAWIVPLRLASVATPAIFQLWASANFDDTFRPSWIAWLPTATMLALGGAAMAAHHWLLWRVVQGAALVLVCAGIWQVLGGREGDLIEGRRRFRLVLATGAGLAIAAFTVLGALSNPQIRGYSSIISATVVLALAAISATLRLGLRLQPELGIDVPCRYGLILPLRSYNPLWIAFHEFVALGRDLWRAGSWRDRRRALIVLPGAVPAE